MKHRPTSVTVIAWVFIIMGGIGIVTTTIMMNDSTLLEIRNKSSLSIPIQNAKSYFGTIVILVSGLALLKGYNWSRLLYIGWCVIGFVIELFTSPFITALIPSLIVFIVVVFFLFRPKANEYFSSLESSNDI